MSETAQAAEKKVRFCSKEYDMDTGIVTWTFGNGTVRELDTNELSEEIRNQLMLHGASQKGGDSYAGAKGDYNAGITALDAVLAGLKAGQWGSAGDDAKPRLAELAEAISRIKQVALEKATAAVEKASEEQRKQWRSNAAVKATIAQLRSEKAMAALEAAREAGTADLNVTLD